MWRLVVHHKFVAKWNEIGARCGQSNAEELWLHLALTPDQAPKLGSVTPMKGKLGKKVGTLSRVYHYEISGAARLDYRFDPKHKVDSGGDEHPVVFIIGIDFSSH